MAWIIPTIQNIDLFRQQLNTILQQIGYVSNPAAQRVFAGFTTPPDFDRQIQIGRLISDLQDAGVYDKLDLFYVMAAADSQAARVNWISPGATDLVAVNSPTFTTDRGYTGDGASAYLDTGAQLDLLTHYTLNSASVGGWVLNNVTGAIIAGLNAASTLNVNARNGAGNFLGRVNDAGATGAVNADSRGFWSLNRSASNARQFYLNGASYSTDSTASTLFSSAQLAIGFAGGSLTADEHAALYEAAQTYLTSVGAI
jgi:hypothetical protein